MRANSLRRPATAAVLWGCVCALSPLDSLAAGYTFQILSQSEGLSESNVTAVLQDGQGFMWFGTQDGVDRYDGYSIRVFRHHTNDPDSLSDSYVTALYLDSSGTLWVGTRNGLDRYDLASESFVRYLNSESTPLGIGHITEAGPGRLWLATDHGLLRFDRDTGRAQRFGAAVNTSREPLLRDRSGVVWIGTARGLAQIDSTTGALQPFTPVVFSQLHITALHEAHDGTLWVGAATGEFYSISAGHGLIEPFPRIRTLTQSPITAFADSPDGSLWLGTQDHGLVGRRFDGEWITLRAQPDKLHGLPSDDITDLASDSSGNLWIALISPGVARLNPLSGRFQHDASGGLKPDAFATQEVRAVAFDAENRLWMGGTTHLQVFDTEHRGERSYALRGRGSHGLAGSMVETLFRDHESRMWVGLKDGGLCLYRAAPDDFRCYRHRAADSTSLSDDDVISITEDQAGVLWLGTLNGGLDRFDPALGQFRAYRGDPTNPQGLTSDKITSVVAGPEGELWLGTYGGGVNRFDPRTGTALHYRTSVDTVHGLSSNDVVTVMSGDPGKLWIATTGGLDELDTRSGAIQAWTTAEGMPSDLVFAMAKDSFGMLWLGTNNGLVQFDPARGVVRTFSSDDGLPANEFVFGASARSAVGTLFMGTVGGLAMFNPIELASTNPPPRMRFTGLSSYGQPILPQPGVAGALLPDSISETRELRLPYTRPQFTLEFAALGALNPVRERYAYRLVGLDDRWSYLEPGHHSVSYSALPPGDYTFEVRPGDAARAEPLKMSIRLPPPPWLSGWAYAAYLLLLTALAAWLITRQRKRLAEERRLAALSQENEARLQLALWASGEGTWDARPREAVLYCAELMQSLGYRDLPQPLTTHAFLQLLHPDDRMPEFERYRAQARAESGVIDSEFRIRNSTGEYVWWKLRGKVVRRDVEGNATRAIGMAKDISADKEQQTRLQLAALFMENSTDSIAVMDHEYRIIKVNKAFERMTGYSELEMMGKFPAFLSASSDPESRASDITEAVRRHGRWNGEGWIRRRSGENFMGRTQVDAIRGENGNLTHYVGITADITRQRLYEDELRHLASYDALTGLPNRTLLSDRLEHAIASIEADGIVGVVLLSLDLFSRINDSLGHDTGDEVLRETARRLLKAAAPGDTVSRVGGDTFALLLASGTSPEAVDQQVTELLGTLTRPVLSGGDSLYLTASAGISLYPRDGSDPSALIKNAETALFKSKLHSRGTFTWYSPSMGVEAKDHLELHSALHRALERGELSVHYQPKLRVATGEISGVEALVRWQHPEWKWVSPSEFIPVAETSGLIDRLGEWVLSTACRDVLELGSNTGHLDLAVNLSPKQVQQPELSRRIAGILRETRFPPQRLRLELTESMLMHNPAESAQLLKELRQQGILLAVDDFGTGYSSLGYLRRFPVGEIKVDKSFVQDMDNRYTLAIIKAIVALGRSLDMEVTAEGVEDRQQAEVLSRLGCTQFQGYLVAAPMDIEALQRFMANIRKVAIA